MAKAILKGMLIGGIIGPLFLVTIVHLSPELTGMLWERSRGAGFAISLFVIYLVSFGPLTMVPGGLTGWLLAGIVQRGITPIGLYLTAVILGGGMGVATYYAMIYSTFLLVPS